MHIMLTMLVRTLLLFRSAPISSRLLLRGPQPPHRVSSCLGQQRRRSVTQELAPDHLMFIVDNHHGISPRQGTPRRRRNHSPAISSPPHPSDRYPDSDRHYDAFSCTVDLTTETSSNLRIVESKTTRKKTKKKTMTKRSSSKVKVYAVAVGRKPGIYHSWADCEAQVKGYPSARFKSFPTQVEARTFIGNNNPSAPANADVADKQSHPGTTSVKDDFTQSNLNRPLRTAARDAHPSAENSDSGNNPDEPLRKKTRSKRPSETTEMRNRPLRDVDASTTGTGICESTAASSSSSSPSPSRRIPNKLWFHINFDGGARGNPHGVSGAGTLVVERRFFFDASAAVTATTTKTVKKGPSTTGTIERSKVQIRTYLGFGKTNNQAEYEGAISGLNHVLTTLQTNYGSNKVAAKAIDVTVVLQGDSDLVIRQLKGLYNCNSPKLKPLLQKARALVKDIKMMAKSLDITYEHVYRRDNSEADGKAGSVVAIDAFWQCAFSERMFSQRIVLGSVVFFVGLFANSCCALLCCPPPLGVQLSPMRQWMPKGAGRRPSDQAMAMARLRYQPWTKTIKTTTLTMWTTMT